MDNRQSVMFLEVQCGQFIVAGNDTNYLQTDITIILSNRCDTQRFLLAASSPARTEFEKNRNSFIILRRDLSAVTVHERKFKLFTFVSFISFVSFQKQYENHACEDDCKKYPVNMCFSFHSNALSLNHIELKRTAKVLPSPGLLVTVIEPLWASTINFAILRPRPQPSACRARLRSTW